MVPNNPRPVVEAVVFTLLLEAGLYVINFVYDILTLSLKVEGLSTFKRLTMPMLRVAATMALVLVLPHPHMVTIMIVTEAILTVVNFLLLRFNYSPTYDRFCHWYSIWQDNSMRRSSVVSFNSAVFSEPQPATPIDIESQNSDIVDYMYSVSPKNTFHIDQVVVNALCYGSTDDQSSHETLVEIPSPKRVCSDPFIPPSLESMKPQLTWSQWGHRFFYKHFFWLLPSCNHCSRESYPLLKRKLSTYSLASTGPAPQPTWKHPYPQFRYFLNFYYDITMDDNDHVLRCDPMFKAYGVPSPQIGKLWSLLHLWCQSMMMVELVLTASLVSSWQGGIAIFLSMCMLSLWYRNSVIGPDSTIGYRRVVGYGSLIHLIAASIVMVGYFCF